MFLLLYVATALPYNIAFVDFESGTAWYYIDLYVDICFILDLFINFISAYYDKENKLVTDNKIIAKRYLRTWFVIDLIAAFPFNEIFSS
jgi:hypothetical protein